MTQPFAYVHEQAVIFRIIPPKGSDDASKVRVNPLDVFDLLFESAARRDRKHGLASE